MDISNIGEDCSKFMLFKRKRRKRTKNMKKKVRDIMLLRKFRSKFIIKMIYIYIYMLFIAR